MGRSRTFKYSLHLREVGFGGFPMGWSVKDYGKPTDANLLAYVKSYEASTQKGGVNEHLGPRTVAGATIIDQTTNRPVAQYHGVKAQFTFAVVD